MTFLEMIIEQDLHSCLFNEKEISLTFHNTIHENWHSVHSLQTAASVAHQRKKRQNV
jgi:hypothetical protein